MTARKPDPDHGTLNDQLLSFYRSKEVPSTLSDLIASTKAPGLVPAPANRRPAKLGWLAIAAAVVVALFVAPALFFPGETRQTVAGTEDLLRTLAAEVAAHHLESADPGLRTGSFAEAAVALAGIDFDLDPLPAALTGYELEAAKHGSLNGQLAAQLKVIEPGPGANPFGPSSSTLHVTRISPALAEVPEGEVTIDGVVVRFFRKDGRLFVLARDAE